MWTRCVALFLIAWAHGPLGAQAVYRVAQLPPALKALWERSVPEMSATSRCAAAFDASEGRKMTLQCSIYIRMAAEGERRALRLCEDKRQQLAIEAPCRLVQP